MTQLNEISKVDDAISRKIDNKRDSKGLSKTRKYLSFNMKQVSSQLTGVRQASSQVTGGQQASSPAAGCGPRPLPDPDDRACLTVSSDSRQDGLSDGVAAEDDPAADPAPVAALDLAADPAPVADLDPDPAPVADLDPDPAPADAPDLRQVAAQAVALVIPLLSKKKAGSELSPQADLIDQPPPTTEYLNFPQDGTSNGLAGENLLLHPSLTVALLFTLAVAQALGPAVEQAFGLVVVQALAPVVGQVPDPAVLQALDPAVAQALDPVAAQVVGQVPDPAVAQALDPVVAPVLGRVPDLAVVQALDPVAAPVVGQVPDPAVARVFVQAVAQAFVLVVDPAVGLLSIQASHQVFAQASAPVVVQALAPVVFQALAQLGSHPQSPLRKPGLKTRLLPLPVSGAGCSPLDGSPGSGMAKDLRQVARLARDLTSPHEQVSVVVFQINRFCLLKY
ncbi:hypothetical protein HDE_10354 [Halotydeus destructor]|nr:hypothetical protein HDE_10354 [Halotydeus destructor]